MSETIAPSKEELLSYFDKLSNWGRWGDDDQLGTLNLITPKQSILLLALGPVPNRQ